MAKMYHEKDADVSLIRAKLAVVGYDSGHAHALSLKDSGHTASWIAASSESHAKPRPAA